MTQFTRFGVAFTVTPCVRCSQNLEGKSDQREREDFKMAYFFDDDVVASGVEQYVLFGIPTRAVATTFNGEYDLVAPYGSTGNEDEGIEIWLSGEEGEDEAGIFIRGTIERGVPGDLIAQEIDTIDVWQDEDGTPHILIAAADNEVVLTGDPNTLGWVASLGV